jgi:hypothetical protein
LQHAHDLAQVEYTKAEGHAVESAVSWPVRRAMAGWVVQR